MEGALRWSWDKANRQELMELGNEAPGGRLGESSFAKARREEAEREVYSTWVKALGSWVGTQGACC